MRIREWLLGSNTWSKPLAIEFAPSDLLAIKNRPTHGDLRRTSLPSTQEARPDRCRRSQMISRLPNGSHAGQLAPGIAGTDPRDNRANFSAPL